MQRYPLQQIKYQAKKEYINNKHLTKQSAVCRKIVVMVDGMVLPKVGKQNINYRKVTLDENIGVTSTNIVRRIENFLTSLNAHRKRKKHASLYHLKWNLRNTTLSGEN